MKTVLLCFAAVAVFTSPANAVVAQSECSWKNRTSLPPPVQRYLSNIFHTEEDRYRPYRFSVENYLVGRPGRVLRRVNQPGDIDRSKPYFFYQSNSAFPAGLLQLEAGMPSKFEHYLDSSRILSHYHLAKYDGIDFAGLGPVSFIGFNSHSYPSPDAQMSAIIAMNPALFEPGKYAIEKANNACLIATQSDGERMKAMLTIYDSSQTADANLRRQNFLQCRDRHYARFLGLRFWPATRSYSKSVPPMPAPDHDYSKLPPIFAPPPSKPRPVSQLWSTTMKLTQASNDGTTSAILPFPSWEVERSESSQKIIALEGSSDFAGVCRVTMEMYRAQWDSDVYRWADELRRPRVPDPGGVGGLPRAPGASGSP